MPTAHRSHAAHRPSQKIVHRNLNMVTPAPKGPDVRALQEAINHELKHRKLGWRQVKVDGELGDRTLHAADFLGWVLGFSGPRRQGIISYRPHLSEEVQRILRHPSERSAIERARESARKAKVAKIRHSHNTGPALAIAYLEKQAAAGVHEIGETNTGPQVDIWEAHFGIHAEPWCGCLAGYAAIVIGGSKATTWFPYGPSIMADAQARRNGVYEVGFDEIEGGEVLVLWGGEHVVTAAGKPFGDSIRTGEGNTSPTDGNSQADGGACAMKVRSRSDVSCVARVYG